MELTVFMGKDYLAVAYSGGDMDLAVQRADIAAAYLMEVHGSSVFSPITHSHRIARYVDAGHLSHEFWLGQDRLWLDTCDRLVVLMTENWKKSFGVAWEIGYMTAQGKTVYYLPWKDVQDWWHEKILDRELNDDD